MAQPLISIPGVELLDELGRGAHSVVYRVRRGARYYALKVPLLDANVESYEFVAPRFLREAVALARLRHPVLPAVMEVGTAASGPPYIIMELAAGETLAERLRLGPLDEEQVLELATQLADALISVHHSGLVHRDVKPANILFDAHTTAVRLVDFGLARSTGGDAGTEPRAAMDAADEILPATASADLMALGAVLFECLSGSVARSSEPRHTLQAQLETSRARPSPELVQIVLQLLSPRREAGYCDAQDLLDDLCRLREPGSTIATRAVRRSRSLARGAATPFLGRSRELERLRAARKASSSGRGQVVLVRGPRGVGKTRLVGAFVDETANQAQRWFAVRCEPTQREPFSAVRQLLEAYVADFDRLAEGDRDAALEAFREQAGDVAPLLSVLSPRLSQVFADASAPPRADGAEHIFCESLANLLGKLLNAKEVTVVIDDAQWLDAASRRVIGRLTDDIASRALYILVARDDSESFEAVERVLRVVTPDRLWELPLLGLEQLEVEQLIQGYLGSNRVEQELLRCVVGLSDGTPLGVLETVRSLLDAGVVVPNWGDWNFDREAAARMDLPRGSLELIARRIAALGEQGVQVLLAAAVIGSVFDQRLVAAVSGVELAKVRASLFDARRALVVAEAELGRFGFVHDAVREALLSRLDPEKRRALHQRAAEALEPAFRSLSAQGALELDARAVDVEIQSVLQSLGDEQGTARLPEDDDHIVFAIATHYLEGRWTTTPERLRETASVAARLAFRSFDHELALRFFDAVERAEARIGVPAELGFLLLHAESLLRTGAIESGLSRLRSVAARAAEPSARAFALYRAAWAQMQLDTTRAWHSLQEAFQALGIRPPSDSVGSILRGIASFLRRSWLPWERSRLPEERRRNEVLAALYFQAGRLAFHTAKPARLIHSALSGLLPAERVDSSTALSRGYLHFALVLTALGFKRAGQRYALRAERAATNPVDYAQVLQGRVAIAGLQGDAREALRYGNLLLDEHGQWRELSEYCVIAYSHQQIEAVRGRNLEAWKCLERAVAKLCRHEGSRTSLEFIEISVRATLLALGRRHEIEGVLRRLVGATGRKEPSGSVIMSAYGSRARLFTECADLGEGFEALVREVEAGGHDPRRVPLELTEYYVHVAHARVHACLQATPQELPRLLGPLQRAANDLRKAARMPLLKAHALTVDGYCEFFNQRWERADRLLARAERLAEQEGAPWVLYAVHRCRAHQLLRAGRDDAARDAARVAEALAREHGALHRLAWIRKEFSLTPGSTSNSSSSRSENYAPLTPQERVRRSGTLRTLVRLGERSLRELHLSEQVRAVIDELIDTMHADRGFLFLTRERLLQEREPNDPQTPDQKPENELDGDAGSLSGVRERLVLVSARNAAGHEFEGIRVYDARIVEDLFTLSDPGTEDAGRGRMFATASHGERSVIVAAMTVRGERIGAIYLDRPLRVGPFTDLDARDLAGLAAQVPLVLELASSLRNRERIEETERSAEKLEAIGRLAGGIAHDFNNMLSVILAASSQILSQRSPRGVPEDVKTIQSAAERARDLTRQLLAFSRGQYLNPEVLQLNDLVERLEPIFRRLLGPDVALDLDLELDLCRVRADPAQIDQVLTNLIVNAGDAMGGRGRLEIHTSTVLFVQGQRTASNLLAPGRYACIRVADSGEGMDEATVARAFEPFFTTKDSGSGLGLATAYGIIAQSGGHIELESRRGVGTTFRIYLPETGHAASGSAPISSSEPLPRGSETVLLVDDEPLVRESTRRMLVSLGYCVLTAKSPEEALSVAREQLDSIALVISDVMMPGMNGLELARELGRMRPSMKVLFVSGYTAGVLAERGVLRESVAFLQKPIALESLAPRLRGLLGRRDS